uniref:Large ribosomal subunit protein uL30m n=1 Tax=Chlamydomonas euryale TaxID=1486919 RepID=A0A7R9YT99_9CHLO|mmetsp:Transcript_18234/g.54443  ORF Transcript_18234/g.54443 Transcript_18234/m.54443 type:complete len:192 (+) Transcript_18234:254-829(+)
MPEPQAVRSLFVTLRRGMAGKPWFHRRVVEALGLSRRHDCVEKPNNASIRGMLHKVPHLVVVETDRMYFYRRLKAYYDELPRPPLTVAHAGADALPAAGQPRITAHVQALHAEHVSPGSAPGFDGAWVPKQPTRHRKDRQTAERVAVLTELGVHSQKARKINEALVEARRAVAERKRRAPPPPTQLVQGGV